MRDPHGVLSRWPEQLVFCADTGRRACGTSVKVDKNHPSFASQAEGKEQ